MILHLLDGNDVQVDHSCRGVFSYISRTVAKTSLTFSIRKCYSHTKSSIKFKTIVLYYQFVSQQPAVGLNPFAVNVPFNLLNPAMPCVGHLAGENVMSQKTQAALFTRFRGKI